MNASATDFRLWLKPTVLLIETVKRLAARVNTRRTNHDNNPSLVKKGNLTVAIKPKHTSSNPRVEMLANRTVLFQFFFSLIVILFPAWSELWKKAAQRPESLRDFSCGRSLNEDFGVLISVG